jgi:hypothetical protein
LLFPRAVEMEEGEGGGRPRAGDNFLPSLTAIVRLGVSPLRLPGPGCGARSRGFFYGRSYVED